ncbi:SAG-related sequence [Besnoitia besnoiti]|uniref:SAG-related sequence n=1 Tax=Besnoitia besnoiti TaxID=94643 RepID=A0A2A9MFP1_BESBE|nr:SAG-related sequence [Besnoitia besnoiti]PFH36815.1 SAG-related sequence [Besnoitia besnoiti]
MAKLYRRTTWTPSAPLAREARLLPRHAAESTKIFSPGTRKGGGQTRRRGEFSLTILEDKFPENGAKLMVQCQKKTEETPAKPNVKDAEELSVCSAVVTVEGTASASASALTFASGRLSLVAGVALPLALRFIC